MDLKELLRTFLTAYNESQAGKAFGPDWRERKQAAEDTHASSLDQQALRAVQLKSATGSWDAKLKAAQQLYPELSPEDALAKVESEGIDLERKGKRAEIGLREAQAFHFRQPSKEAVPKSLQHVETADGIRSFNPATGEMGPVIGKGKPNSSPPSIQIVQTPDGFARVDKRTGKVMPIEAPAAVASAPGGPGQLQPKPTDMSRQAASQLSDMTLAAEHLSQMLPGIKNQLGITHGAGPKAWAGQYLGTSPDLVTARNEAKRLFDLVYLKSGKQINEREMAILKTYLPDINQHPDVFERNLARFYQTLQKIREARGIGKYLDGTPAEGGMGMPMASPAGPASPASNSDPLGIR